MTLALYRNLTSAAGPFVDLYLRRRLARGKEDAARLRERLGMPSRPRPQGSLVWVHAASVGESVSVLPLVERLLERRADLHLMMTTGTVTSASVMAQRLPERALHQYVPLDRPANVRMFLDHWHPEVALWVESELWPNLVHETRRRGTPMVLLNARVSERSYRRWRRLPGMALTLLRCFDLCVAQSVADAGRFSNLGCRDVVCCGNLKTAAAPLPVDASHLERLARSLGERPRWLAASTHPGEEAIAGEVHRALRERFPDLLTIIVPRHPERGREVADALRGQGLAVRRRAGYEPLDAGTEVYVADTVGELGLFYRLSEIAFIGGSLVPHGGQNPLEAARLGCALLYGRHMENFADSVAALSDGNAAEVVSDAASLGAAAGRLLGDGALRRARGAAAQDVADAGQEVLDKVLEELGPYLPPQREAAYARA